MLPNQVDESRSRVQSVKFLIESVRPVDSTLAVRRRHWRFRGPPRRIVHSQRKDCPECTEKSWEHTYFTVFMNPRTKGAV